MTTASLFDLTGKVALVTGGSRGIGRALVEGFAAAGADVVVVSRKFDACKQTADEVSAATGRRIVPIAGHMGKWDECNRVVDEVYAQLGKVDILVNNAGMSPLYPDLDSVTEEYFDKVVGVNLKGPFRLGAAIGTRMAAGDGGSIINISSIGSLRPGAQALVYSAAKAGLNALTIGLAEAFGPTVRSNGILPGGVLTDIAESWTEEETAVRTQHIPLRRGGTPADFVGTALWLAGDASAWITGELVRVDGGAYRQMS
ncbi:SDR family NAD(P)-dependent oxidoreductase [Rhodococcoides yunnanense]|uniref:SDR family NAD(P)-dependent oxidoreductase n=1 Tax=Rhodococcoides yunnanense TaxID=278209 RepID=UPI000932EF2E|nr:glucose 1-dehydrogenase [Rhodococcus yunnanensis]